MWEQNETIIKYHEIEMLIKYAFSKGEEQTYDYVGSADQIEIEGAWIENTEMFDLLSSDQIEEITTLIEEQRN